MLDKIINSLKHKFHFCSHAGCYKHGEDVIECYLPDYEVDEEGFRTNNEPDYYYCWEHADTHGFCKMCGEFWAGIESFEFIHPGFCDNCDDEMERDFDRDFDDEDYFDDFDAAEQPLAPDVLARCSKCNALIETTVHCDNCGTFEPTRR